MPKWFHKRKGAQPYTTPEEKLAFAILFLRHRAMDFKKNLDICLTARPTIRGSQDHAYMPGLLITVAFIDLLSGLYAGDVENHDQTHFLDYTRRFFPTGRYTEHELRVLYVGFRHKIAHLNHPYFILDTSRERGRISKGPHQRITFAIYAAPRRKPIEIRPDAFNPRKNLQPTPGPTYFDHRVHISIKSLARDARNTLRGPNSYVAALRSSSELQKKIERCLDKFYAK